MALRVAELPRGGKREALELAAEMGVVEEGVFGGEQAEVARALLGESGHRALDALDQRVPARPDSEHAVKLAVEVSFRDAERLGQWAHPTTALTV